MWNKSLRFCTVMVQVMLTTVAFAEHIVSAGKASSSPAGDDELRDLMQSLLLEQRSTNPRLERLEDQKLPVETQHAGYGHSDRLGQRLERGHRRNRSSRAIFDISADGIADLLAEGAQRTSVLLNRKIYQEDDFRESQRHTWTSLDDHLESVAQSNNLLQTWTDQPGPSPPYALNLQVEYAADAYEIDALHENIRSADQKRRSRCGRELSYVFFHASRLSLWHTPDNMAKHGAESVNNDTTQKKLVPPTVSLPRAKDRSQTDSYLHKAFLAKVPANVVALHDYIAHDDGIDRGILTLHRGDHIEVISQLESGWCDGIVKGARGWVPSNHCASIIGHYND